MAFPSGASTNWDNGLFLSGWAPFNPNRWTADDSALTTTVLLAALRSALR